MTRKLIDQHFAETEKVRLKLTDAILSPSIRHQQKIRKFPRLAQLSERRFGGTERYAQTPVNVHPVTLLTSLIALVLIENNSGPTLRYVKARWPAPDHSE